VRTVLLLAALVASVCASVAAGSAQDPTLVPEPAEPTTMQTQAQEVAPPPAPCVDVRLRCPDLVTAKARDLKILRGRSGRVLLGSRNVLVNRGAGPLFLLGERDSRSSMTVRQRIYSVSGRHTEVPLTARFDFWPVPGQGSYWKLRDALRFELWTAGEEVDRLIRMGRKTRFCMRDLAQVDGLPGPRSRAFGGCNQSASKQSVRMGISVGWLESYPSGYHEQHVDVTGLRGCYSLRHVADPLAHIFESDETNNVSRVRVRLPPRRGRVRGC